MLMLSHLNDDQKSHLAWRLHHDTPCPYGAACQIARGELGDVSILEMFKKYAKSERSAKVLTTKVQKFILDTNKKRLIKRSQLLFHDLMADLASESSKDRVFLMESLRSGLANALVLHKTNG